MRLAFVVSFIVASVRFLRTSVCMNPRLASSLRATSYGVDDHRPIIMAPAEFRPTVDLKACLDPEDQ